MILGKASTKVPPNATSHTSCQLHSGPIAATISRRSTLVLPATKCSTPAPMSQPSSTTNTISVTHKSANHVSTMRGLASSSVRAVQNLSADQVQEQQAEHEVQSRHPDQREQHVSRADNVAEALTRCLLY